MKKSLISGQTALITGASSGIGKACAEHLASIGVHLIITARRLDRLNAVANELSSKFGIRVTPVQLDVQKNHEVEAVFKDLAHQNIEVDILVNNAGLALSTDRMQEGKIANWETMIDTNLKGLLYMTKAALGPMIKRNRGHIINMGSVAGHGVYLSGNVYSATKHAVRAISKSLRIDLMGTAIRVSQIDPGAVNTEFSTVRWNDKSKADKFYEGFDPLVAEDIADAVVYCATRPPHVNIAEIVIYPQAQASMTDLFREGHQIKSVFDNASKKD